MLNIKLNNSKNHIIYFFLFSFFFFACITSSPPQNSTVSGLTEITPPITEDLENVEIDSQAKFFNPIIHKVYFKFGTFDFKTEEDWNKIAIAAEEVQQLEDACVEIFGFTSNDGRYQYNLNLAKMRAQWVSKCLIGEGVPSQFIVNINAMEPLDIKSTSPGECRRSEIHILPCLDVKSNIIPMHKEMEVDPINPFNYISKDPDPEGQALD